MQNVLEVLSICRPIAEKGNKNSISDAGVAIYHLETALKSAYLNVLINQPSISDEKFVTETKSMSSEISTKARTIIAELTPIVESRIG